MFRPLALLLVADTLSLPSLTYAETAPEAGAPAVWSEAPLGLGGPVTARAAIAAAVDAEVAAALAETDTVEVARYATLAEAIAAAVTQDAKLTASDGDFFNYFGVSVSLDGDRALVGASKQPPPEPSPFPSSFDGAAYVFAFDGTTWSEEAKLTAPNTTTFGVSVSLEGDRALIGDAGDKENGFNAGAAYVFVFDGTTWSQQARLTAPDASLGDRFGEAVSLSGDRVLLGALGDDDVGNFSGSAYVFAFNGTTWVPQAKLTAPNTVSFGESVSLLGDRALIGASGINAAYVFTFDGAQPPGQKWSQQAKLTASDGGYADEFGSSVSLSGERALVGAWADDNAGPGSGSAYVFAFDGTTWSQEAKLIASDGAALDRFGTSVSLSGGRALVGAPFDTNAAGTNAGAAYVFAFNGTGWSQETKLVASDGAGGDKFGEAVLLLGERALVGAPSDFTGNGRTGSAYVLDLGLGAPLVADAGPDQTVIAGQTVTLDGTGSSGASPLSYAWTLSNGATLSGATTPTPSFCAAAPGAYTATLVVSGDGGSDSDAVTVTAQSPSAALIAIAGGVSAATALNQTQKAALVSELKKAQRALARGLSPAPFLDAFRSQVQGLQAQGVLTAAQAGALIGFVDAVDAAVASPCSNTAGAPAVASATAAGFGLSAWPNPSAGRATVAFSVETATTVRLSVHDALGREVAVLVEGTLAEGPHEAALDTASLPAGVYLVRLATADGQAVTEHLTRLR